MNDPKRMREILGSLGIIWWTHPNWSFTELIEQINTMGAESFYLMTDQDVTDKLNQLIEENAEKTFLRPIS